LGDGTAPEGRSWLLGDCIHSLGRLLIRDNARAGLQRGEKVDETRRMVEVVAVGFKGER